MSKVWEFIFLNGEFAPRGYVLEGLTAAQAGIRPGGTLHSIYEELWHTVFWHRVVLERRADDVRAWEQGGRFPDAAAPRDQAQWDALVAEFLALCAQAVARTQDEAWLDTEEGADNPGLTWRDALDQLAVHNAYHLGKIVTLRQLLGCWVVRPRP